LGVVCFLFLRFWCVFVFFFFFNDTATTEIYTLSLHDALPICVLPEPGVYGLHLGGSEARVAVSRSDMATWRNELDELRGFAQRLETIATEVDRIGRPSANQAAQIRKRLQQERERLAKVKSGFNAGLRAIEEALDRLFFYRSLLNIPDLPEGETVGGYTPPPKEKDGAGPTAVREVRWLRDVIAREGALLILEELRLVRTPTDETEVRVLRWRDADKAVAALRKAHEILGGFPELGELLKEPPDASDPDDLPSRLRKLRASILRP